MKKIFYLILTIVLILAVARIISGGSNGRRLPLEETAENYPVVKEDADGNMTVDGEVVEDIVEENPAVTADEEETVIQE